MKEREIKALFPEGIETLTISKNDYDRLYGEMTLENIELKQELERLHSIIKEVREKIVKDLDIGNPYVEYDFGTELLRQELLEILDKVDKEN